MIQAPALTFFSTNRRTRISADSSSYGLGAVLEQYDEELRDWRPVYYASRSLSKTEKKYVQIEKEALALTWACEKFATFIIGAPDLVLRTDHKPLIAVLGSKLIDDLSPRLQRF